MGVGTGVGVGLGATTPTPVKTTVMNNNGYASNIGNISGSGVCGAAVVSTATPAGHRKRQQELQV